MRIRVHATHPWVPPGRARWLVDGRESVLSAGALIRDSRHIYGLVLSSR